MKAFETLKLSKTLKQLLNLTFFNMKYESKLCSKVQFFVVSNA